MAVVLKDNSNGSLTLQSNCYKVGSLTATILEADQISNLKDRYILEEQLGWGQFGVIKACTDKWTGEALACKSISKDRLVTSDDVKSVKHEIEIMTRLSGHPNVVDLKAVYEEEEYVHLVMELCAGGELFHQLEQHGPLSESEARVIFKHLMQVVLYCHQNGIVHRDLKPENILLTTKASLSPIKLADFGLATYINPGQSLHGLVGSPFYIAPEVLAGGYNEAADVWSAGVILYVLLSGMPPFWGKTKSQIFDAVRVADLSFPSNSWDHISESALDLIKRMLCTDPSQRLNAQDALDHLWMTSNESFPERPSQIANQSIEEWDVGACSFSTSFMSRNQDISFGAGSHVICDTQSTAFTCISSLSSSSGFSFHSSGDLNDLESSSLVSSMPSFAFFRPASLVEHGNCKLEVSANLTSIEATNEEGRLEKLLVLSDHSLCFGHVAIDVEKKQAEVKMSCGTSGTSWSRMSAMHSKINRTIGLGEHKQLDLLVAESVIRWSSCTHLSTSLRSSLVC